MAPYFVKHYTIFIKKFNQSIAANIDFIQ